MTTTRPTPCSACMGRGTFDEATAVHPLYAMHLDQLRSEERRTAQLAENLDNEMYALGIGPRPRHWGPAPPGYISRFIAYLGWGA